jgi:hypothetical protein
MSGHQNERIVARRGRAMMVNRSLVNRSAPELFLAVCLVKKRFIRRETRERRAFERPPMRGRKALKRMSLLSLTKRLLNRI